MARFDFRQFSVDDAGCGMKICSDSVLFAAWFFKPYGNARYIADVGAGSGILSLFAALLCPKAEITGLEIEAGAAQAARLNSDASPWSSRITIIHGDFADWHPANRLDLIVSNPPYFTGGLTAPEETRATARHQSSLSYISLIDKAVQWLAPDGHLGLIAPAEFTDDIIFQAEMKGLKLNRLMKVTTSPRREPSRVLFDFSPTDNTIADESLSLRDTDGKTTEEYRKLVEPYYIRLS